MRKNRMMASVAGATLFATAFATSAANADALWRIETTNADGSTETGEIWANDKNLRMSVGAEKAQGGEVILLGDADELIFVDHAEGSFTRMKASEIAAKTEGMGEQMAAARSQMSAVQEQMKAAMAEAMANMSPEERERAMAAMANVPGMSGMNGAGPLASAFGDAPTYSVERTGDTKKVMGATAVTYQITRNGAPDGEVWAAKTADIEGGAMVRDRMKDLFAYMETAMGGLMPGDAGPFRFMSDIDDRVPVGGVSTDAGGAGPTTTRLVSAADISPPDGIWNPPAGYKEEKSPF
ncbi:MAG: hypothetical protein GC152_02450 [Alphaproteobacteria bacterium]|nr:hypothetical protein [Alphaproteobacteria bacterium]